MKLYWINSSIAKMKALRNKDTKRFMKLERGETKLNLSEDSEMKIEDESNSIESESSEADINDYWYDFLLYLP